MSERSVLDVIERRYGIAGKAAGEAALEHGRDGARIRSCQDAFVLSRIARAVVDALAADDGGAVEAARKVLRDHEITDLEDGGRVYVDALALAELRDAIRALEGGQ